MVSMLLTIFLFGFLIFSLVLLFIIASAFLGFATTRVPFVPTSKTDIKPLAKYLNLSKGDVIYELGSGNGKVVFLFEKYSEASIVGFESTLWTHLWAVIKKKYLKSKAKFVYGNFWKKPWTEATVIYCYLYPPLMAHVAQKAKEDCKPGTRIITRDFYITEWKPVKTIVAPSKHEFYIYEI